MRELLVALAAAFLIAAAPAPSPSPAAGEIVTPDAVTQHTISLGGKSIAYTARAGTIALENDKGEVTCRMFYTAFTADGVDPRTRPVTFLYNGGPGSSSVWLRMGSFGPMRVRRRRCGRDARRAVQSRRESVLAARPHRSRLRRRAGYRLQPNRRRRQAERFLRRRPRRTRLLAVRLALRLDVQSLEFAEVSLR